MMWIVDRIEDGIVVCEIDDKIIDVPLSALPNGVKEGDVITLTIDKLLTEKRAENINNLMNSLFKD